jgi:hypothetical protein
LRLSRKDIFSHSGEVNTATATTRGQLTADEAFAVITARRISITPALDGPLWVAMADIKGDRDHNRSRAIRSESAISSSPLRADSFAEWAK